MAFFEDRFPDEIAMGATGGPRFKTSKATVTGGARTANKDWDAPLHYFNVAQAIKTREDFHTVRQFFWVVAGAFDGFRFKDFSDYEVDVDRGVLTLISAGSYQLGYAQRYGSRSVTRAILKPVAGTVQLFRTRTGATTNITVASTIDTTTGIVGITGHTAGDTYTWSGEFDIPMAFSDDSMDAAQIGPDGSMFINWTSIQLEEIRDPS